MRGADGEPRTRAVDCQPGAADGVLQWAAVAGGRRPRFQDPQAKKCVAPYVDHADVNGGGPHSAFSAAAGINGGTMNGSIG